MLTLEELNYQIREFKHNNRDWNGLRVSMHPATLDMLKCNSTMYYQGNISNGLFGIPIDLDYEMPERKIRIENNFQRKLRQMREAGVSVVVQEPMDFSKLPAKEDPTLKALLKHWWNRLKRRNK